MKQISYQTTITGITPAMLAGFFVGWPNPPDGATHLRFLEGSQHRVLALADGRVVGFVTAISDGVLCAYIPLLEVLPAYQGQGIGSELVRRLLAELDGLYAIDLMCDVELQPFYEHLGFQCSQGMIRRNYEHQAGRA